jgi:hypothetical protein
LRTHLVETIVKELRGIKRSVCSLERELQPQHQPHAGAPHMTRQPCWFLPSMYAKENTPYSKPSASASLPI